MKKYFLSYFLLFNLIACSSASNIDNDNVIKPNTEKNSELTIPDLKVPEKKEPEIKPIVKKENKVYIIETGFSKTSSDKIINEFKVKTKGAQMICTQNPGHI